jgi:hypothetical protein
VRASTRAMLASISAASAGEKNVVDHFVARA